MPSVQVIVARFLKLIDPIAFFVVRKQFMRQAQAQGTGRHTQDEIAAMGVERWGIVSDYLDSRPYMLASILVT
jgi:hypothetical protein